LKLFNRDVGTGYHQPEGILLWQKNSGCLNTGRETLDSRSIAPTILQHFAIDPPEYMQKPFK